MQNFQALRRRRKRLAVKYLGGKCIRCGYDKSVTAMQFHHRDPSTKSFGITGDKGLMKPAPEVQAELDKCVILCANCHAEEHYGVVSPELSDDDRLRSYSWWIPVGEDHESAVTWTR